MIWMNISVYWMNVLRGKTETKKQSVTKEKSTSTCKHVQKNVSAAVKRRRGLSPAEGELTSGWAALVLGAGTGTPEESNILLGAATGRLLPSVTRAHGEESSEVPRVSVPSRCILPSAGADTGSALLTVPSLTLDGGRRGDGGFEIC